MQFIFKECKYINLSMAYIMNINEYFIFYI